MSSILELPVEDLAQALAKAELSAVEVLKAYQARAEATLFVCFSCLSAASSFAS